MLVLASSSPYRRALLERLGVPFEVRVPDVDEARRADESPAALAQRLALAKANAVARELPGAIVIGSDQVAELDGQALGKPGDAATARAQLERSSGRSVRFHTAVAVLGGPQPLTHCDLTEVVFRRLTAPEIAAYVERDAPLDCAGSFRSEGLGAALFERVATDDPSALIGLPLIAVARMLRETGVVIL